MIASIRLMLPSLCLTVAFCFSHASAQGVASSDSSITVSGTKVTKQDLKGSERRASFPKTEITAVVSTGKPNCAYGTTEVHFDGAKGLSLADELLSPDELIKRVIAAKVAGRTSCLVIHAASYDKSTFDRLDAELVVPQQISLMWETPD